MLLLNFMVIKSVSASLPDHAYIGPRVAQRSYGVPSVDYEPTYDNLGRITNAETKKGTWYLYLTYLTRTKR